MKRLVWNLVFALIIKFVILLIFLGVLYGIGALIGASSGGDWNHGGITGIALSFLLLVFFAVILFGELVQSPVIGCFDGPLEAAVSFTTTLVLAGAVLVVGCYLFDFFTFVKFIAIISGGIYTTIILFLWSSEDWPMFFYERKELKRKISSAVMTDRITA